MTKSAIIQTNGEPKQNPRWMEPHAIEANK